MIAMRPEPIEPGAYRMTVLDVGHGLSVVVETARHVLVYDAGPRVGSRLDAAALAVLPYLARRGHDAVDRVVLSPRGLRSRRRIRTPRRIGGSSDAWWRTARWVRTLPTSDAPRVSAGDWDGVSFEVLYPFEATPGFDNAHSCVVRIEGAAGSVLLTGDIESGGEQVLVARLGGRLATDVLVVPHHGSATSSTRPFLESVSPAIALFSASGRGRFRLPHPAVVSRYVEGGDRDLLHLALRRNHHRVRLGRGTGDRPPGTRYRPKVLACRRTRRVGTSHGPAPERFAPGSRRHSASRPCHGLRELPMFAPNRGARNSCHAMCGVCRVRRGPVIIRPLRPLRTERPCSNS